MDIELMKTAQNTAYPKGFVSQLESPMSKG